MYTKSTCQFVKKTTQYFVQSAENAEFKFILIDKVEQ